MELASGPASGPSEPVLCLQRNEKPRDKMRIHLGCNTAHTLNSSVPSDSSASSKTKTDKECSCVFVWKEEELKLSLSRTKTIKERAIKTTGSMNSLRVIKIAALRWLPRVFTNTLTIERELEKET